MESKMLGILRWVGAGMLLWPAVWVVSVRVGEELDQVGGVRVWWDHVNGWRRRMETCRVGEGDDGEIVLRDEGRSDWNGESGNEEKESGGSEDEENLPQVEDKEVGVGWEEEDKSEVSGVGWQSWIFGPDGRVKRRLGPSWEGR
eukprot:CAMPEP_0184685522 /NCGR_PEP_ID=MMETSP0312-20130426/19319_1 /TAXON_ID=31354 /ORGANISM="Compsopogon coeruleus, Strain SAG 36.94" /LENGTH=143 /DNA_ID=CAMNT_0027139703 /DNA_START=1 /DNA_END=432 /DNA_ORIENTATION=+